jgi:hypothetical protein
MALGVFAVSRLVLGALRPPAAPQALRRQAALLCLAWLPLLAGGPLGDLSSHLLFWAMGVATAGMTLSWACCKEVNAPQFAGIATGVANMGIFLGPAVMQPVVGWVLDLSQGAGMRAATHTPDEWQRALLVLAGVALFGFANALFVRETRARNVYRGAAAR